MKEFAVVSITPGTPHLIQVSEEGDKGSPALGWKQGSARIFPRAGKN